MKSVQVPAPDMKHTKTRFCHSLGCTLTSAFIFLLFVLPAGAANIPVYNTNDAFAGSLRQAIGPGSNPGDTIVFQIPTTDPGYDAATGVFTITLNSYLYVIKDLVIDGSGSKIKLSGANNYNVITVDGARVVTISKLTIANGNDRSGGSAGAGGIRNLGTVILRDCTFTQNTGLVGGFTNYTGSIARIDNCTFASNTGASDAGAIYNGGTLTMTNSTIVANGEVGVVNSGSGIMRVRNSIIAANRNTAGTQIDIRGSFTSEGYNFIGLQDPGSNRGSGFGGAGTHDQVGSAANPANPNVGPLQDNGGLTQTAGPLVGSLVIDQGNRGTDANGNPINTDQRGQPRPIDQSAIVNAGDGSDIGAVEIGLGQVGPTFTVTNTDAHDDASCTTDDCTLVEAMNAANSNADVNTILFASAVSGVIDIYAPGGLGYIVTNPLTILGPGARTLAISGKGAVRLFRIAAGKIATISGLTLQSGGISDNGGAILNLGDVTLRDCAISNNRAAGNDPVGRGGGVYNAAGASLTLLRCTFLGNQAGAYGGGVFNDGTFTATNCTFYANIALRGGGIITGAAAGVMTLRNCTVVGNSATDGLTAPGTGGGGVFAAGNASQHFLGNCLIAGNNSTNDPDIRGNYTSDGHNLIGLKGDSTGLGVNGDIVLNTAANNPAGLDTFSNHGGATDTWSLLGTSPAIDAGDNSLAPVTDQRGYLRANLSDIGAFEFNGTVPVLKILSIARPLNGHIVLQASGVPNSPHTIQISSDLVSGFPTRGTAASDGAGFLQFDDADAVGLTKRFYRATFP